MHLDRYSSVIQLATALSLAGWVARNPDTPQVNLNTPNHYYDSLQNGRYHPYANRNHGNTAYGGNYENSQMIQQQMNFDQNSAGLNQNFHQSKDAEEHFRSFLELQELRSWQEANRRGDLANIQPPQLVMPVISKGVDYPVSSYLQGRTPYSLRSDDGYGSESVSLGSPASSVLSGAGSTNLDDNNSLSPLSDHVFDMNDFESLDIPGATGFTAGTNSQNENFDIDELLDFNDNSYPSNNPNGNIKVEQYDSNARQPFENLKRVDEDLDYVNSLKSPTFDEFLANPMLEQNSFPKRSFEDDPFQFQFTNSSFSGSKRMLDTLIEFNSFDPSFFENPPISDEDIDEAFVTSLSSKNAYSGGSTVLPCNSIKKEFPFKKTCQGNDHDYLKPFSSDGLLTNRITSSYKRTFAPANQQKSKLKHEKHTSSLLWPDFHYTSNELISMPVEEFNEAIKSLDMVRQHVAKDIRRKGKNKLAARNCRKRKMDVIENLDNGVEELERTQRALLEEKQKLIEETQQVRKKTEWLNNYIFEQLRDTNGNPYSSSDYSLQYTSDGNVYLVPSGQMEIKKSPDVEK